ncbi:GNAT family N-acetyltransferase [Pedobacter sp. SYP-B3415]|uniref:GNAT family N-acetyltransferase n=1 Tax=Pedobacter sp. SYP-B3415 TaxID=2496641 RepID=UPI00101C9277|nr:GNAT family N-acetyltransferase [Pedobacter sp. SYP-B3415]
MIGLIKAADTLPLRSLVLRDGKPLDACIFPTDEIEGSFHVGYLSNDELVCIASFFPEEHPGDGGVGYRLRGMATNQHYQGQGLGSELVKFAIACLTERHADYLWCNARAAAMNFYRRLGFEVISAEFDIPGIGPHFEMKLNLK